jgi:hypothetical protein
MLRLNELKREQGAVTSPRDGARPIFIICGAARRGMASDQKMRSRRRKEALALFRTPRSALRAPHRRPGWPCGYGALTKPHLTNLRSPSLINPMPGA